MAATGTKSSFARRAAPAAVLILVAFVLFISFYPSPNWSTSVSRVFRPAAGQQDNTTPAFNHSQHLIPDLAVEPHHPRCRTTTVSMLYGDHDTPQLTSALETHRRHTSRWGCGFAVLDRDISTRKYNSKLYFLLATMLTELSKPPTIRQEWLLWVDADTIILNPAISPEVFLPPSNLDDIWALMTADDSGFNAGVFYLKICNEAVDFLTRAVAYPLDFPNEDLGSNNEQTAMFNILQHTEAVVWMPRKWFNAYQIRFGEKEEENWFEGEEGSFLVHFPGLRPSEIKLEKMEMWLEELERDGERWEVGYEETFYGEAIDGFWEGYVVNGMGRRWRDFV